MKIISQISFEKIISFIFFINIKFIYSEQPNIKANYPTSLLLQNGVLFISNIEGIFITNVDLINWDMFYTYNAPITNQSNVVAQLSKLLVTQFEEDKGLVICLLANKIYFFNYTGLNLFSDIIPGIDYSTVNFNLNTYKKEGDYFYYIITYIYNLKIFILYYKVNENEKGSNQLISNNSYTPFYLDYPAIEISSMYISCQIMNSNVKGDVLTCCFQTSEGNFIVIQSFQITKNFEPIGDDISFTKIPNPGGFFISTSISNDKKNLISFYRGSKNHGYYFIYNIDEDKVVKNDVLASNCHSDYNKFKLFKVKETNEFVFLCSSSGYDITIVRMKDENGFRIINRDSYTSPNYFFSQHFNFFNLLYDSELQKYKLIIDPIDGTDIYTIDTDFNSSFPGGELPEPLILDPPCNRSVLLREDNKYFIYSNGTYLKSSITINEKNGVIIDFFDGNHFINHLNQDKVINKSFYAMDIEDSKLEGQLKYVLENGEEKDIIKNEKLFGEFKIKYIPPQNYFDSGHTEEFFFQLILKNFSIATYTIQYSIVICAHNCSCNYDAFECESCAENYSFFNQWSKCYANSDLEIGAYYDEVNKIFKSCHEKCKKCSGEQDFSGNMNCLSCYEEREEFLNGTNCYEKNCDNLFYKDKDTLIKTCINEAICPDNYPILDISTKECKLNITIIDNNTNTSSFNERIASLILDIILRNKNISSEEFNNVEQTYMTISCLIKNNNISNITEDIVIKGKDVIYQITTTENQKNEQNNEASIIDLGECEKIIKRNISSYEDDSTPLIILKIDVKKENLKSTLVEYEVFNPYNHKKINLDICSNAQISISAPINLTNDETSLYESVSEQGYDVFDSNNSFYQDFCTPFTSANGTDVIIADRKSYYFNEDIILCEDFCSYKGINTQTKKVICKCSVKTSVSFDADHFNIDKFLEGFYEVKDYTNYQVLFCYKLIFSKKGIKNNICFYIFLVFFLLFVISVILNLFLALKKIDELIFKILRDKFMFEFMKQIIINGKLKRNGVSIANEENSNNENNLNLKENRKLSKEEANKEKKSKKLNWLQKLTKKKSFSKNIHKTDNVDKFNKIDKIDNKDNIDIIDNSNNDNSSHFNSPKKNNDNNAENNNEDKNKNKKEKHHKDLSRFFGNFPKNNDNTGTKRFTNYFYNYHDNENPENDKNFKNYFNSNIQVINNYNIYNLSGKKKNSLENDSIKENNNNNDLLSSSRPIKKKKNIDKNRKFLTNSVLINDKSNGSNPPIKKKDNNNEDENQYTQNIEKYKKMSRKHKNQSLKIKRRTNPKNHLKFVLNETPAPLISNQSIVNSKKEGEETPKKSIFSKKNNGVSNDVINIYKSMGNNKKKEKSKRLIQNNNNKIKYIDEELNRMEYKEAIINDKRNYLRYYYSLLEKKQLIILTFIANNDLNVFLLKLSLFIISFMLYFSINTLFFRDSTMRRIFIDQGKFRLIYQIPQILYSTLISTIMTFILKRLSLSQNDLIKIRKEKDKKRANKIAVEVKKNLRIKLYIFFIIGIILILFCWYYISAFGAVYPNTQVYLIKDTLISFAISMCYPFAYNLIPGLFRFPALKAKKKDKKSLYDFSRILSKI